MALKWDNPNPTTHRVDLPGKTFCIITRQDAGQWQWRVHDTKRRWMISGHHELTLEEAKLDAAKFLRKAGWMPRKKNR